VKFPAYNAGDREPGLVFPWLTEAAPDVFEPIDLSVGFTFTVELIPVDGGVAVSQPVNPNGYVGRVEIDWLVGLPAGTWRLRLRATETATGAVRTWNRDSLPVVEVRP
jgi:hypothetical protein